MQSRIEKHFFQKKFFMLYIFPYNIINVSDNPINHIHIIQSDKLHENEAITLIRYLC